MQNTNVFYGRCKDTITRELNGGVVVLKLTGAVYYGLDDVGTAIWNRLAAPSGIADLVTALTSGFDVSAETAEPDVLAFLSGLLQEGLIETMGQPVEVPAAAIANTSGERLSPYRSPVLERGLLRQAANKSVGNNPDGSLSPTFYLKS